MTELYFLANTNEPTVSLFNLNLLFVLANNKEPIFEICMRSRWDHEKG